MDGGDGGAKMYPKKILESLARDVLPTVTGLQQVQPVWTDPEQIRADEEVSEEAISPASPCPSAAVAAPRAPGDSHFTWV